MVFPLFSPSDWNRGRICLDVKERRTNPELQQQDFRVLEPLLFGWNHITPVRLVFKPASMATSAAATSENKPSGPLVTVKITLEKPDVAQVRMP